MKENALSLRTKNSPSQPIYYPLRTIYIYYIYIYILYIYYIYIILSNIKYIYIYILDYIIQMSSPNYPDTSSSLFPTIPSELQRYYLGQDTQETHC